MVIFVFWLAAMVLCLVALALLLPPLLRRASGSRRRIEQELATAKRHHEAGELDAQAYAEQRQRLSDELVAELERSTPAPARALAFVLAVAVPGLALALYFTVGQPQALDPQSLRAGAGPGPAAGDNAQQMQQAIASLEQRLRDDPDQIDGWLLLARSYRATERFPDMLRATSSAMALAPTRPDVLVEHAEALALNSSTRRFDDASRALLDQALVIDPRHQKALWLLGVAALQEGRNEDGLQHWQRLRELLPADDPIALRIDEQIAAMRARNPLAGTSATNANGPAAAATEEPSTTGPALRVTVELDPSLADQVRASDVLFVFARHPAGGPPLAIQRLTAERLPVTVTLSQSNRMIEGMQIEPGQQIAVGARISRDGQAQAQPGDLQSPLATLQVAEDGDDLTLRISETVPTP